MTSLYRFWCGISISLWMSEWDCQNFEESKQDENFREPMLIALLLYTHFKINLNLDRMFWLYSLYSMDQLTCGIVASCLSQRPLLSGLGQYALLLQLACSSLSVCVDDWKCERATSGVWLRKRGRPLLFTPGSRSQLIPLVTRSLSRSSWLTESLEQAMLLQVLHHNPCNDCIIK